MTAVTLGSWARRLDGETRTYLDGTSRKNDFLARECLHPRPGPVGLCKLDAGGDVQGARAALEEDFRDLSEAIVRYSERGQIQ